VRAAEAAGPLAPVRVDLAPAVAAFSTRSGGVSAGPFASLNLGAGGGDDPAAVAENGRRLARALGFPHEGLARVRQVHGAEVAVVERPGPGGAPLGEFDAAVTERAGVVLLVLAADCVPVLLVDPERPAVAAVHAGWRGVAADAPGAAVRRMAAAFGSRPPALRAAIGPCIGPCCYEVDAPVADAFAAAGLAFDGPTPLAAAAPPREGRARWRLDLAAAVRARLQAAGVPPIAITAQALCTACRADLFYSHRRDGPRTGRQAGVIWLPGGAR